MPELASRDHIRKVLPLLHEVMAEAGCSAQDISGVAYTAGPGLAGALLVGSAIGRSLAWAWGVPAVAVHHMEGHLLSPMLEDEPPQFPFLALLVSGGHTLLADVQGIGQYRILGESIDDAVGEAFDKTAKLLGLGYPGGPAIAQLAADGNSTRFKFPRPMTDRPGLDFSFSGLKTAVVTAAQKSELDDQTRADLARCFQDAAIDTLVIKCQRALEDTGHKTLVVAGGVSANQQLRQRLQTLCEGRGLRACFPRLDFSTDNGAMIAFAGYLRLSQQQSEPLGFSVKARWNLEDLPSLSG